MPGFVTLWYRKLLEIREFRPRYEKTMLPMKQAIAGVAPSEFGEVKVMTVWPSNAAYGLGRLHGRLYGIRWPDVYIFQLGHLLALLSIPGALAIYFLKVLPVIARRYTITNRRIMVQKGLQGIPMKWVDLDRFDTIDIVVQPGQEWYMAGDLIFRLAGVETFRLDGVSRPDAFRAACLKSRMSFVGVKKALKREAAMA